MGSRGPGHAASDRGRLRLPAGWDDSRDCDLRLTPARRSRSLEIVAGDDPARVQELAIAADFTVLIAPETSGILASLTRELEHAGARLLGSRADAVELAGDKARMAKRLQDLSIDTPPTRTVVPGAGLPPDAPYPAVLKPVDGAGSMDTFYLPDAMNLPDRARPMPIALLQPFVPGTPMAPVFWSARRARSGRSA